MKALGNKKTLYLVMCGMLSSAITGCHGGPCDQVIEPQLNFESTACDVNQTMDLLTDLNAQEVFDSISLYHHDRGTYSSRYQGSTTWPAGGNACSRAVNTEQCNLSLSAAEENLTRNAVITTQDDQVTTYKTPEELLAVLGEINNEKKALLWMHINGFDTRCSVAASPVSPIGQERAWFGTYTQVDSSWLADRVNIQIEFDGTITELDRFAGLGECPTAGRIPPGELTIEQATYEEHLSPEYFPHFYALGRMFAKHAAYEAASVVAFEHLKAELEHYGAPTKILEKIDAAAKDEVRHAQQVGDLAKRFGAKADNFKVEACGLRSLKDIALDNLKEGCIGETWGALVGLHQAEYAQHSEIRKAMKAIAVDEVGHAALSWEIHEWLYAQLDEVSQKHLDKKKAEALHNLKAKISRAEVEDHQLIAGIPSIQVQQALIEQLSSHTLGAPQALAS